MLKIPFYFQDCIRIDNDIWFASGDYNGLYRYNLEEKSTERIVVFPHESFCQGGLFLKICKYKNNLILVPQYAKRIYIFNIDSGFLKDLAIPALEEGLQGPYFCDAIVCKEYIYMMGTRYPGILKVNLENDEVEILGQWLEEYRIKTKISNNGYFLGMKGVLDYNNYWIPCYQCNKVLKMNMQTGNYCFYEVGRKENKYARIIKIDNLFVLVTHNSENFCRIAFWDASTDRCDELQIAMQAYVDREIVACGDYIWVLSFVSNEIYRVGVKDRVIKSYSVSGISEMQIVFARVIQNELFFCDYTQTWHKINNLGMIEKVESGIKECTDEKELEEIILKEELTDRRLGENYCHSLEYLMKKIYRGITLRNNYKNVTNVGKTIHESCIGGNRG